MRSPVPAPKRTSRSAASDDVATEQVNPRHERAMRRRLGEVLVAQGVLNQEQLDEALAEQAARSAAGSDHTRLGRLLVDLELASEEQVAEALGELLALDVVDLSAELVDPVTVRLIPRAMAERFGLLVLAKDSAGLRVAAADPTNVLALDDVRIHTRERSLHVVVATPSQIQMQLQRVWSLVDDATEAVQLLAVEQDEADDVDDIDQTPTVKLLDALLGDAVRAGASDIHVEPQRDGVRIRYRVDGLLRDVMTVPRNAAPSMVSRIKIISGLDIAERRVPQDGRTRITVGATTADARVSTLPTIHGEKVVIRLLTASDEVPALHQLGLLPTQLQMLRGAFENSQGLVLITGPTGSGKTNTLYAAIQEVMTPERNLVTLEDPVEIQVPGITQVNVNAKTGLSFARGLRAVLRQDPDVVLVGEIRDRETAELALRASLTGHLVLSTVHTNGAAQALTRLVDMDLPPYLVATSLSLVVGQRLLRRVCDDCAVTDTPDPDVLELLDLGPENLSEAQPRKGRGCLVCGSSGYRGRIAAYELLSLNSQRRRRFTHHPVAETLLEGEPAFRPLRAAALTHAAAGVTTYEEVLRVTPTDWLEAD